MKKIDNGKIFASIFKDLSKAFDTINHNLSIANLEGYRLSDTALMYMISYLSNRKQRVNVNNTFSAWESIIACVLQDSILEPLIKYFP